MNIKSFMLLLLFFCTAATGFTQTSGIKKSKAAWLAYTGQYKFTPKLGLHAEVQMRNDAELEVNKQDFYRFGLIHYINPNMNSTMGYARVKTYQSSLDAYYGENRIWEQFYINHPWHEGKLSFAQRFRLEQRWVEKLGATGTDINVQSVNYQNRFRYFAKFKVGLKTIATRKTSFYTYLQDEVFIPFGNNKVNTHTIDQNRLLIGLGITKGDTNFEIGYLNHLSNPLSGKQLNNTVSFAVFQNLNFSKGQ